MIADADDRAPETFRQALGLGWTIVCAASGPAAQAEIQRQPCDLVVADIDLPEAGGAELLDNIRGTHPATVRFLAASEDKKQRAMCHVAGGNQFLAKPFDAVTLKNTIERSLAANLCIVNNSMRELIGRIRAFPTIPSLYLEVLHALNNPDATTEEVGAIVAKDMAMTTQLLQMLNSAYFSLPRTVTDPAEAVGLLGFETVKSLIMSVKLRNQYDKIKPVYFSIDAVWRHSTLVARLAKELALLQTGDSAVAASAFTAGLLHDLGKIILAANFDGQYNGAHAIARKNQVPLCDVESDIFGANHGQIAAYLLSLWGMPADVIEATASHHHPSRSTDKSFCALTAIHVANALEHESNPDSDGLPVSTIDIPYLQEIGLENRLPDWCRALGFTDSPQSKVSPTPAKPAAAPPVSAPVPFHKPPASPLLSWQWLVAGLSAVAGLVLLSWVTATRLEQAPDQSKPEIVTNSKASAAVRPTPSPAETSPKVVALAQTPRPSEPVPRKTNAQIEAPSPPAVPVVTEDLAFNEVKLQGIVYSAGHPSAIINGKVAQVSQHVAGCLVLEITPTSVTLEHENHRKTLTIK
ncbi:MAG: HDOD domain-containing protein [Limisphaerales bacterium]